MQLRSTQLVFLLGLILLIGAIGGRLFQKLRIPQVVGYIVFGIFIGSSGFQILGKETIAALNPISTVALSLIGFLVGGELKSDVLKKYGKQFVGILLFESITPFFIVGILISIVAFIFTKDYKSSVALGLLLGAICAATAPAATTDVLEEYRSRGPLTTTTYGIVAMDDAVGLILYAIASTIAAPLLGDRVMSFGAQILSILRDIFVSIFVGGAFGFLLSKIIKNLMQDEGRILTFSLGMLFLATGVAIFLDLDNILAAMALGFFMVNFAPAKTRETFKLVDKFTPPVYVLFFVLVGARLNIWMITPYLGLLALVYVGGRTFGKTIGSRIGGLITKAPPTVTKYLAYCLFSQAGVAIGLSIVAGNDFPNSVGPMILLIVTATTFIVQLIGPVFVKKGITAAGEVGLNVTSDDILKTTKVSDVTWGPMHICDEKSPAIVDETEKIGNIIDLFSKQQNMNYAVRDSAGKLSGVISLEHLKEVLQIGDFAEAMLATDIMDKPTVTCKAELTLPDAYKLFSDNDKEAIAIVDDEGKALGMLEKFEVDHYVHQRLLELTRKAEKLG